METIAQQLNVKKFPFEIKNDNRQTIYYEESDGDWFKQEFDDKGCLIHYENNRGFYYNREFNSDGNVIYFEDYFGFWFKKVYDNGTMIYYEDSRGKIIDNKPKELTLGEIAEKFNTPVEQLKIKK
jgi:hypothetical protein